MNLINKLPKKYKDYIDILKNNNDSFFSSLNNYINPAITFDALMNKNNCDNKIIIKLIYIFIFSQNILFLMTRFYAL